MFYCRVKCRVLVPLGILQDVEGKLRPLRQGALNRAPLGPVPGRISSGELARKKMYNGGKFIKMARKI